MVRLYANDPLEPAPTSYVHTLDVTRLHPGARLPELYDTKQIALDVFAFLLTESGRATSRAVHLKGTTEVPTGIKIHPPAGYYVQVSSRLSLARRGIFVANAPVIIPPGFDGELTILLFNGSYETQYVAHEHRIAHLILQPIINLAVRDIPPPEHKEDVHSGPRKGDS